MFSPPEHIFCGSLQFHFLLCPFCALFSAVFGVRLRRAASEARVPAMTEKQPGAPQYPGAWRGLPRVWDGERVGSGRLRRTGPGGGRSSGGGREKRGRRAVFVAQCLASPENNIFLPGQAFAISFFCFVHFAFFTLFYPVFSGCAGAEARRFRMPMFLAKWAASCPVLVECGVSFGLGLTGYFDSRRRPAVFFHRGRLICIGPRLRGWRQ